MEGMPVWLSTTILGFGTVFVGLICLIILIKIMGFIMSKVKKEVPEKTVAPEKADEIQDRGQFVAAVSAAIATVMGTEVNGLRIKSIKKVS